MKKFFLMTGILVLIGCSGCARIENSIVENSSEKEFSQNQNQIDKIDNLQNNNQDQVEETISIDAVDISFPKQDNKYIVISSQILNSTKSDIIGYTRGMLALDEEGNILELYWNGMDSSADKSFYYNYTTTNINIKAGEKTEPIEWILFNMKEGAEKDYDKIKYILYTFEEVIFSDGTVWENADMENWLNLYMDEKVNIQNLEKYYPYIQVIEHYDR